jgi:hypothetical protein
MRFLTSIVAPSIAAHEQLALPADRPRSHCAYAPTKKAWPRRDLKSKCWHPGLKFNFGRQFWHFHRQCSTKSKEDASNANMRCAALRLSTALL